MPVRYHRTKKQAEATGKKWLRMKKTGSGMPFPKVKKIKLTDSKGKLRTKYMVYA